MEKARTKIDKILPHIIEAITFIIAVLTALFAILIGAPSISQLFPTRSQTEADMSGTSYPEFSVDAIDEETNTLTITIDGKSYEIELKNESLTPEENPKQPNENLVQPNENPK